ncbi:MAG: cysteine peptidase family C39 domain-containing protein [Proteobacteria bacterium]|jgi:ABC-type bacteriocin/lantibiotic exporter with double-glycine peptidase domain|nr:cysteine peptidase family C39 domain-containing protein [Pseudomonadota bacterium]
MATLVHCKRYPVPESFMIQNFPTITQPDDISCGPTSCVMVAEYYGKKLTVVEAKKLGKTIWGTYKGKEIGMTSPDYVPVILQKVGLSITLEKGNLNKLQHYVSLNKPIMVLVRTGDKFWHYVVVIGYNQDKIFISDPGFGEIYSISNKDFLSAWSFSGTLRGEKIPTNLYGMIVEWADVKGNLMFVPK